jgi:hypothetical protein
MPRRLWQTGTWVRLGAGLAALVGFVYLLVGEVAIGVGFLAGAVAAVVWEMTPASKRGIAGGQVRSRQRITAARILALLIGLACVFVFLVQAALGHWSRTETGKVALFALTGLEALLFVELRRGIAEFEDLERGAEAEELDANELAPLKREGWFVDHNREKASGGNLDHVAIWPHGAFAIETKSGRYRGAAGVQALAAAMALREEAGVSWVTAVVCIPDQDHPCQKGNVWVVGRASLADWLRSAKLHRGRPIDFQATVERLSDS